MPRILILSNPRSGSTLLMDLLNCHPEIHIESELLNDEIEIHQSQLEYLDEKLSIHPSTFVGFKVFSEQIFERELNLTSIVRHLGVTQIIVLWRESILETLVSRRIADQTGIWYEASNSEESNGPKVIQKQRIEPEDLISYTTEVTQDWNKIADQWPIGISPIYVKFEDLIANPQEQVKLILSRLGCPTDHFTPRFHSKRQNPGRLESKVENYFDLPQKIRDEILNVQKMFGIKKIQDSVICNLPTEILPFAPDREPTIPSDGWRYRVAEPFISNTIKQNVYDAIESGSISSAGYWPRLMASKLKQLFQLPVCQPCCNGFTALMLALQCMDFEEGDEVIMPSMTMVAVPNAAYFVKARPIFADCAEDNFNPGWKEILAVSSEKTKVVIVTHTYGVPSPDLEIIAEECQQRGWWLIEDISEAVGVETKILDGSTKLLGTFGHFACASLYVNKMIHAGDGGFVMAKDPNFGIRLTSLVNHGFTPSFHFVHFEPALNAKINGIGAAIACGCVDDIDKIISHRSQVAQQYRSALSHLPIKLMPLCGPNDTPWVFGIVCESKKQRTELRSVLAKKGIETRDFFFALHLQPAYYHKYDKFRLQPRLPLCEKLGSTGFYLPTYSNLMESDVEYIANCVQAYFGEQDNNFPLMPLKKNDKQFVQIPPGTFRVEIRTFNESGSLKSVESRTHAFFEAIALGLSAEKAIIHERWDTKTEVVLDIRKCMEKAELEGLEIEEMRNYFAPYLEYFESQSNFEPEAIKPWIQEDITLSSEQYPIECAQQLQQIPTTTDPETLQLLLHLIREYRPETIWEIGCWMGHATFLMASLSNTLSIRNKIFACDAFKWQNWMERHDLKIGQMYRGNSFLEHFKNLTDKFSSRIQPIIWPYDISTLPEELRNQRPGLIYLDITQEEEDLDRIWELMQSNLIPSETIIVFNGLSYKSIPFFTKHASELQGIAKPSTLAKAFIYRPTSTSSQTICKSLTTPKLATKVNFQSDPEWTHHHKNLFCSSIADLRAKFHDPNSLILFFPAVEERMCNEPQLFLDNPWIGIIHSVPSYPQQFYTPDLSRLCSPRYGPMMQNCKGLFTLTQLQANYLQQNLSKKYSFPIQSLKYPVEEIQDFGPSNVLQLLERRQEVNLIFIGSFTRDFEFFFKTSFPKGFKKVLLVGDDETKKAAENASSDIKILSRLGSEEYEKALQQSIVFLALVYDGAANTIILECIARNVPILSPNMESCIEYLGPAYPLLYDPKKPKFEELLTPQVIEEAITYLKNMDKSHLSRNQLTEKFTKGAVLASLPPAMPSFTAYDVTICICSYKRTHHLPAILQSLWNNQDFPGSIQIIIWNNNDARAGTVRRACNPYIQSSTKSKSLELISSSENHFCSIRFAMPQFMKSERLLICDDDIIPGCNFISFFLNSHTKLPKDVLCVRGHVFLDHKLNLDSPRGAWENYEGVRFRDDSAPEQLIHFVHADACLIPVEALREVASVPMPDPSFTLVDDYWMSFILSHKFNRKLRKLSTAGLKELPFQRTEDSDQVGLALHTRPEVRAARIRLYIHHMLQQWPTWGTGVHEILKIDEIASLKESKSKFWDKPQVGFNISSKISQEDVKYLSTLGVKTVRIGAVGVGKDIGYDLCDFLTEPERQLLRLEETVTLLAKHGISSVLTLDRRIASSEVWSLIASKFGRNLSVVGYDLVNEPHTEQDLDSHWLAIGTVEDSGIPKIIETYKTQILSIRQVDAATPIIIEPSFWGRVYCLKSFPISVLKAIEPNLIVSIHFYEPMLLTQRYRNKGRFTFPSQLPIYDDTPKSELMSVDEDFITQKFQEVKNWGDENGVKVFVGEFGICRNIQGAQHYLGAGLNACKDLGISGYVFSFRDHEWDGMNYEFGPDRSNLQVIENSLMNEVVKYIGE